MTTKPVSPPSSAAVAEIERAVGDSARPPADLLRDASSRPVEVLSFIGFLPGMTVLDVNAATGYYTELLSRVVGSNGHVIAHNHPGARSMLAEADLERRYGSNRLPNTEQLFARHDEISLMPDSLDAVLMSMVYHDTYWYDAKVDWGPVDQKRFLQQFYRALRPGGVIGVVDHYAAAGSDPYKSAMNSHRIDPTIVRKDFLSAGFVLKAESSVLRNRADNYSLSVFDARVQGKTDRFVLLFQKPG